MTTNLSTLFNADSLYERLIQQVIAAESQPKATLKKERDQHEVNKAILGDYNSKVSALKTAIEKLSDPFQTSFSSRAATVTGSGGFTASASDTASAGDHTVRVERLARADGRLSKQIAASGTDVAGLFGSPGPPVSKAFTIHVAQKDGSTLDLDVAYAPPDGATNDEVLAGLAQAVNDATAAADLDDGTGVAASVVRETSGTARLSLRSLASGFGNRLSFSDPDGLLAALEVDRTDVRSGTGGGAVYAIGTDAASSALSSAVAVDGLTVYRDTNTVRDAIDGVTLTLSGATGEEGSLNVGPDTKGMRSQVEAFVEAYNGLNSFLTLKTKVDSDSKTRGAFAGDTGLTSIRSGLRTDLARAVTGQDGGGLSLASLGLTTSRDGTLSLSDPDKLEAAFKADPAALSHAFTSEDGFASRLSKRLEPLTGASGVIASRKEAMQSRINRIDKRITRWDARLQVREDSLRSQFNQLQAVLAQVQSQQSSLSQYYGYGY